VVKVRFCKGTTSVVPIKALNTKGFNLGGETLDTEGGGGFNSRKPPSAGFWKSIHAEQQKDSAEEK
jgi:hypothetical protein